MRVAFAVVLVALGGLLMAGGAYFLSGAGLLIVGLWASGTRQSAGGGAAILAAGVALLGGLGVLAVIGQFIAERLTALP